MTNRVSVEDLLLGAEWCSTYEAVGEIDTDKKAIHRVAAWLEQEARQRQRNALIKDLMKNHKVNRTMAAAVADRMMGDQNGKG